MRRRLHRALCSNILGLDAHGVATNADADSKVSREIAERLLCEIGGTQARVRAPGQSAGKVFEEAVSDYLRATFGHMHHLRPGTWRIESGCRIFNYEQFKHLEDVMAALADQPSLKASLAADYLIKPDIIVVREPESDAVINRGRNWVDAKVADQADLRAANGGRPLLHASISCKWTLRSDRAQNARTEAQNLIRNRKGRVPHIVAVTGELLPARLSSLAFGTGDMDCVYHLALPELRRAVDSLGYADASETLTIMVQGRRLKDISDLPLDLAI